MPNEPYPGFPPSYAVVDQTGGLHRTCLVLELLSLEPLSDLEMSLLRDQLEASLQRLKCSMSTLERTQVVAPQQFDALLRQGLRLS